MSTPFRLRDLSSNNRARVIHLLRASGTLSRQEIADQTGLSWGGMTKIVNRMLDDGLLEELPAETQTGPGRRPRLLRLSAHRYLAVGLDVNWEGLRYAVTNLGGEVISAASRPLLSRDAESLRQSILLLLSETAESFFSRCLLTIGVAMQGIVDAAAGVSVSFPRIDGWRRVPICQMITAETGLPVRLEHDPDCILSSLLKQDPAGNALLLRVDSSIGMAVSMNGHLLQGPSVLEIAHTVVNPDGPLCPCGQRGCLDTYTSACLRDNRFHPDAAGELIPLLARSLLNSVQLFNPSRVYITGRLVQFRDLFEPAFRREISVFPRLRDLDLILLEEENRVALGAADLAVEKLLSRGLL